MLRFKKSVAANSSKGGCLSGVSKNNTLFQVTNTVSQQSKQKRQDLPHTVFRQLKKEEETIPINDAYEAELSVYDGLKKSKMVNLEINLLTDFSKMQKISGSRGEEINFNFFLDIVSKDKCPEYNRHIYHLTNDQGLSIRPKTKIIYMPLLDMVPANPTTMQTSMTQAKRLSFEHGQKFCIYTFDRQLYCIAASILWHNIELAKYFYLWLDRMHFRISYVGSIGLLIAGTGIKTILEKAFGRVSKMLTRKRYPQNLRALRTLVEEVLRLLLKDGKITSHSRLMNVLEEKNKSGQITKLWFDALIKPLISCLLFITTEREEDWSLHLEAVKNMVPSFFATSHVNYARWGLDNLHSIEVLPVDVHCHFVKGDHTIPLSVTPWSGILSDMGI